MNRKTLLDTLDRLTKLAMLVLCIPDDGLASNNPLLKELFDEAKSAQAWADGWYDADEANSSS